MITVNQLPDYSPRELSSFIANLKLFKSKLASQKQTQRDQYGWTKQDGPEHISEVLKVHVVQIALYYATKSSNLITVLGYCYVNPVISHIVV